MGKISYKQFVLVVILLLCFGVKSTQAQGLKIDKRSKVIGDNISNEISNADTVNSKELKRDFRKGIVTSSASPFFDIYGIAYFHELKSINNSRGDILLGVAHQNQKNDDGQFNGISLVLGYRQFLYRKLCITGNFYPNYNHFESSIDGETYVGFDGFCEISLGWEFEIKLTQKIALALTPQYTFGQALFRTNPWPRHEEKLQSFHFPDIYIGIVF